VVVEDERQIRWFVRAALEEVGCQVFEAETAAAGLAEIAARTPALVVLDLGLPDRDGVDFIRELRTWSKVPVIVLSARAEESDKIEALDSGADDYLAKPFGIGEMLARVRVLLRRQRSGEPRHVFMFSGVRVDLSRRIIERDGVRIHLTPIEYKLLARLLTDAGKVLTHRLLLNEVWGPAYVESHHYLRIYIGHLRQKLEANPTQPKHLLTETGVGYRFLIQD